MKDFTNVCREQLQVVDEDFFSLSIKYNILMNDVIMVQRFWSVKSENTRIDKPNRTHVNVIQMS